MRGYFYYENTELLQYQKIDLCPRWKNQNTQKSLRKNCEMAWFLGKLVDLQPVVVRLYDAATIVVCTSTYLTFEGSCLSTPKVTFGGGLYKTTPNCTDTKSFDF